MTIIRCIDIETTGFEATDRIVEIGSVDVVNGAPPENPMEDLIDPQIPIPAVTSAIHHLVDGDVKGKPTWKDAAPRYAGGDFYCAHNASFETGFIRIEKPVICTYKVALSLFPDAPAHNLQTLRYWLQVKIDNPETVMPPHRALPDAYLCAWLLIHMMPMMSVDDMVIVSSQPAVLVNVNFGKHKGEKWKDLPHDYLRWIRDKSDMGEDFKFTADKILRGER